VVTALMAARKNVALFQEHDVASDWLKHYIDFSTICFTLVSSIIYTYRMSCREIIGLEQ